MRIEILDHLLCGCNEKNKKGFFGKILQPFSPGKIRVIQWNCLEFAFNFCNWSKTFVIWRGLVIRAICSDTIVIIVLLAPKRSAGLCMNRTMLGSQILLAMILL